MALSRLSRLPGYPLRLVRRLADRARFRRFEAGFHPDTWQRHAEIRDWAEHCAAEAARPEDDRAFRESPDPVVQQGLTLRERVMREFAGKYAGVKDLRILVHLPDAQTSPGGYSLFGNLVESLDFLGIPAQPLAWGDPIDAALRDFSPSVFITSDSEAYLARIDWAAVVAYRRTHSLRLGLTASIAEYGNTPLPGRLAWASRHGVDFYYSFRSPEYLAARPEYGPFFDRGYAVHSIEFGANPLAYYPVPGIERDLDYVFLGSSNPDKWPRYFEYLAAVSRRMPGFVDGPGWSASGNFRFNRDRDRYLYARAKVGLNLHIDNQIDWASELNERTYMLAACGTPQVIDDAKLLPLRFTPDAFYVAATPEQYLRHIEAVLEDPAEACRKVLQAQREAFERHTTFHRAEGFVQALLRPKHPTEAPARRTT